MDKRYYFIRFWSIYMLTAILFTVATYSTNKAADVFVENVPIPRENTIIIDAGHGGEDGGATSCTGVLESGINLEIALRLNDLLHLLGYQTAMIRTTDISVYTEGNTISAKKISDLKRRVEIINGTKKAILVSIHQNTFSDGRYNGAQVFYAPTQGSKVLATGLQTALVTACNPGSNRMAKPADGIYLMQHISCPGVLVECGFLSNSVEESKLRTKEYQNQLCSVIAVILGNYIKGA